MPPNTPYGLATALAVDRLRDLVRRAILARICLASEPDPVWKFVEEAPVDAILSDDVSRAEWRDRWHERMAALDAAFAIEQPRPAVWRASQDDR